MEKEWGQKSMTLKELEQLKQVDVRTISHNELIDLKKIKIDEEASKKQRIQQFVEQIKNPFCFKVGEIVVSVGFSNDGISFEERMKQYLDTL
ncbi:MAG TPA: hypothetical protein IAC14_13460 [Candidatus Scybalomonas excrementigallinarum]|nr:hypothetical protein [Candidatus Scybalomonas excrementigallinarum]